MENIEAVNQVLEEIGAQEVPRLLVYNKIDQLENVAPHIEYDEKHLPSAVYISANSGSGLDLLLEAIRLRLTEYILNLQITLPPSDGKLRHAFYQLNCVEKEEINEQGEFLLNIRLEKTEWLKLVKRFTQLTPFTPTQPDEN